MASIDDRVVSISFDSAKFQAGVSETLASLDKLNASLKRVGAENNLDQIEKSANKVQLTGLAGVLDRIKQKFHFPEASQGFSEVERESNKVQLTGISGALDRLRRKFGFSEAAEGFASIEAASGKVTLQGLASALDGIKTKFSVLSGAASVALGNIASKAAMVGGNLIKSLTISPITGGLQEYQTNLNSIQTILSNTKASGATLKDVNAALLDLNKYSDKTIYNFSQMAKNIGTFTAAGVDLETATSSIKGIANLAAVSGSSAEQASTAMYQLSQAISSGRVSLQDWNSVVNAGMGGTVFQRALVNTAQHMGTLNEGAVKLSGKMKNVTIDGQSFRESVMAKPGEQSWLTSDVLTSTLEQLSGDLSTAELKAQGYSDAQIKAIQDQAKMAVAAATEVKTLQGVLDTAKESVGSGWAQTWQLVFGDFGEAKRLFTGMSQAINGMIESSAESRNSLLRDWKALGGRKDLIEGIKNAFEALKSVVTPIKEAFRDIFPATTGAQLADFTRKFRDFMAELKIGPETADGLKRTFRGLFALLDIGKQIIQGVFILLGHMFGAMSDGAGGVLKISGGIGDLIVALDKWLKKGDKLKSFFAGLGDILALPISLIGILTDAIGGLFGKGANTAGIGKSLSGMTKALTPAQKAVEALSNAWEGFMTMLGRVGDFLDPIIEKIGNAFSGVVNTIADALANANYDVIFKTLQTGILAGIFVTIKKALGGGLNVDIGGGLLENVSKSFDVLRGSLEAMQANIKAGTLLKIAAAVGVLSVSIVALSFIDPKRLASAMTALTVGFGQLVAVMTLMSKIGGPGEAAKLGVMAAGMILVAAAIDVLAVAVVKMGKLSWGELLRGLSGVAALMVGLTLVAQPLAAAAPKMIIAAAGLIPLAVALNILGLAVKLFGGMSWRELGVGLAGAAAGIVAIGLASSTLSPTLLLSGPGLFILAAGLTALGGAVKIFGSMDLATLAKGLISITAGLVAIGLAMNLMPVTLPITAAGLVLVGIGLTGVAKAITMMGKQSVGTLVKGIVGLGGALLVLAVGLTAMIASLPGAAALMVAAAALAVFVPTLGLLGNMSWGTIGKGLAALAVSLIAVSVAGAIAAPGLVLLGAALVVLSAGVALAGAGIYSLAKGLVLLGSEGGKGVAVAIAALTGLVAVLPKVVISFLKGLVEIIKSIGDMAPGIVAAMVKIVGMLVEVVIKTAPKMAQAATALIQAVLTTLAANAGPIIQAGWNLLIQLLKGINDHIGQVVNQVVDIVVKFTTAVASQYGKIVNAGFNILLHFLSGIANNLGRVVTGATNIIITLATGIANNLNRIVHAGATIISNFITGIMNNIDNLIGRGAAMIGRVLSGIGDNIGKLIDKGVDVAVKLMQGIASASGRLADAGGQAIVDILHGIRAGIDRYTPQIRNEAIGIGTALIGGIVSGISVGNIVGSLVSKISGALAAAKRKFKIKSPSQVFADEIGEPIAEGIGMGIANSSAIEDSTDDMINTMVRALSVVPGIVNDVMDMDPTITPVLDLTQLKKDAAEVPDLSNVVPITAALSSGAAAAISASQIAQPSTQDSPQAGTSNVFKFEQNNYSPESLSDAEIYRQTNNQLALAKSALGL